jgi:phage-related baseplate assembly protein
MSNLFGLPDIHFANKDASEIKRDIITGFESAYFEATHERLTLYPGDPRQLFLSTIAAVIALQRNLIDWTGKQNMLAFAHGGELEHLGLWMGVRRLPAQRSRTTVRFTLSAPQPAATIIPAGTRVTPGGADVYFATSANLEIPPGELTGDILALCAETGSLANGYLPGQINRLVDPLPWVQGVANSSVSAGGADIEGDENLRERIQLAPESFSVAGPAGAYEFWARSASQLIVDVGVDSPSPCVVRVYPLLEGGELPTQEMLDLVYAVLSADDIRPTSDFVQVLTPDPVTYDINLTWHLDRRNVTSAAAIANAVNGAISSWILWQKSELGRDINPSELIKRIVEAGAKRVSVTSPAFQALEFNQVAVQSTANINYGGVEDG